MAITDIQISEELETNAPSIKYKGNEGPKSPQEIEMMMTSVDDPFFRSGDADDHALEMFGKPYKDLNADELEEFLEEMRRLMNKFSKGPVLPSDEDPINPFGPKPQGPVLPDRQMAAYGGIMGLDGRRQYGLGSSLKKRIRKLIPNEVAKVAEVAAPFVAPFNPLAAGLMKGVGGFDRTGSIGDSLKSGLMTYGGGQLARGIGGGMDNLQRASFKVPGGGEGFKAYFSSPMQDTGGLGKILAGDSSSAIEATNLNDYEQATEFVDTGDEAFEFVRSGKAPSLNKNKLPNLKLLDKFKNAGLDTKAMLGILGLSGAAGLYTAAQGVDKDMIKDMNRGEGLDIKGIRAEITEAMKDPSGKLLEALRVKYPFLGTQASKNTADMAMGGRIGRAEGGLMNLGGMEKDYRAEGGFVPIGREEKADDVPARLSVNEFVFTADAVRNAGGGDIDKGAEVMENMMKNLEAGGQVSEESQGMAGAQKMFETSERLSEVVA